MSLPLFYYSRIFILTIVLAAALCLPPMVRADQTESEPNSSRFQADGPIRFDEDLVGGLPGGYLNEGTTIPQDYWQFHGIEGYSYIFYGIPVNSSNVAPLDIALDIENASGAILASEDEGFAHDEETLNWRAPAEATFYLIVWEATAFHNGIASYRIECSINRAAGQDQTEPNDAPAQADGPVLFDQELRGDFAGEAGAAVDFWRVNAENGKGYWFLGEPVNSTPSAPLDLSLAIEDDQGGALAAANTGGANEPESLMWTSDRDEAVFLAVRAEGSPPPSGPTYRITARLLTDQWTGWMLR